MTSLGAEILLLVTKNGPFVSAVAAKSLQSCPTLCDPIDGSLPGSSVHGIFQARVLEWVAIAFSVLSLGQKKNHRLLLVQLSNLWSCHFFRLQLLFSV